ncbi:hypothetical protein LSAT2_004168, partial [Lamellibrachia satsuma]
MFNEGLTAQACKLGLLAELAVWSRIDREASCMLALPYAGPAVCWPRRMLAPLYTGPAVCWPR